MGNIVVENTKLEQIVFATTQDISYDLAEEIKNVVTPIEIVEEFKRNVEEKLDELRKCSE